MQGFGGSLADHLVNEADIGEGATSHDSVVAAPGPVRVELARR